jgi:hypothetical protein
VGAQTGVPALQQVGAQAGAVPMSELIHGVMAEESLNQQIHCHALLLVPHRVCICIF